MLKRKKFFLQLLIVVIMLLVYGFIFGFDGGGY